MKSDSQGILMPDAGGYPAFLRQCLKKPPPIYYRGAVDLLRAEKILSVVGSRMLTTANQRSMYSILSPLHDQPLVIMSGLARGLDALAHSLALEHNLKTIAILGSGVAQHEVYPPSNTALADRIIDSGGLLLSPFPEGTPIMPYNFPIRNQLIAALSHATLIASAAKKSGALITARLALEYGKEVFVIPGYVADQMYEGSNLLMQQGAYPILSAEDITTYFGLSSAHAKEYRTDDPVEKKIIATLKQKNLTLNELSEALKLPPYKLTPLVSKLELKSWITFASDGTISLS